jgi:hypothetical protein
LLITRKQTKKSKKNWDNLCGVLNVKRNPRGEHRNLKFKTRKMKIRTHNLITFLRKRRTHRESKFSKKNEKSREVNI